VEEELRPVPSKGWGKFAVEKDSEIVRHARAKN